MDIVKTGTTKKVGKRFFYEFNYKYTECITTTATEFTEVPFYTHHFQVDTSMEYLCVKLKIPFVGNEVGNTRSRLLMKLDGKDIDQFSKFNMVEWELMDITLEGRVFEVSKGPHYIQIYAVVDAGKFHCPHYNSAGIEGTKTPKIQGRLTLEGECSTD